MNDIIDLGFATPLGQEEERNERRDAAENRILLRETAVRLFAEHGVAAVNMADIAKEACVGKGTLYRRFANKGELCLDLLDEELRLFQDHTLSELREMHSDGRPALDQLAHFIEQLVFFIDNNLDLMVEIDRATAVSQGPDINTPHFWQAMTIRGLLHQAAHMGEIPATPPLNIEYTTDFLLAPLDGRIFRTHRQVIGYSAAQIAAGLMTLVYKLGR